MNSDQCKGITQSGNHCKRLADQQSEYCYQHKNGAAKSTKTLYDRLGGVFAIAAVIDRFSDAILKNPMVGVDSPNPYLKEWSMNQPDRLPGLKFMRTLWVCSVTGGPYEYIGTHPDKNPHGLMNAHKKFHISPDEFDAVAAELKSAMDYYKVPLPEQNEVLSAFSAHKKEVTAGYFMKNDH
jgi:hemoglobin